ncbi:MAG: RNA polymerase subunit sigma-24 [Armatimonadota bacterium]
MSGRRDEFERLVLLHERRIYNVAFKLTGDEEEAAELTQETFVRAYKAWGRFRGEAGTYTWLYRILINLNKDRLAALARQRERETSLTPIDDPEGQHELADPLADVTEVVEQADFQEQLRRAILDLPEGYRECVVLKAMEGLSYQEIAESMGITVEAVRSRLARARQHLRQALESYLSAGNGN